MTHVIPTRGSRTRRELPPAVAGALTIGATTLAIFGMLALVGAALTAVAAMVASAVLDLV
jgi:predicted RND superfamily exporter protein